MTTKELTSLDSTLIELFNQRNLVGIKEALSGEFPQSGRVPRFFNPVTESVWTSGVGCYQKSSYRPYDGQEKVNFYRALSITQEGWGSNTFKVTLNLRAPGQEASGWTVATDSIQWIFSFEASKEEILPFLELV